MRPAKAAGAQRGTEEAGGEEVNAADDFSAIAKKWKEIRDERSREIAGKPADGAEPVKPSTVTGSGGFITPDGKPCNAIPENYIG